MDKRFFSFMITMVLVTMIYMNVYFWLFPPPKPKPKPEGDDVVQNDGDKKPKDQGDKKPKGKGDKEDEGNTNDKEPKTNPNGKSDDPKIASNDKNKPKPTKKTVPHRIVSLGSVAPDSPYRFLAIFDSAGGKLLSLELNERKENGQLRYRDLTNPSGYLGRLALSDESGGCKINVDPVGHGTPAANAKPTGSNVKKGLRFDDVIVRFKTTEVKNKLHLKTLLSETKPGEEIALTVDRKGKEIRFAVKLGTRPLPIIRSDTLIPDEMGKDDRAIYDKDHDGLLDDVGSLKLTLGQWVKGGVSWKQFGLESSMSPKMHTDDWEIVENAKKDTVEFKYVLDSDLLDSKKGNSLEVIKRFQLLDLPDDKQPLNKTSHLVFEFEIRNPKSSKDSQPIAYQLDGPRGLPLEGWWYQNKVGPAWGGAGARDVVWASKAKGYDLKRCPAIVSYVISDKRHENNLFEEPQKGETVENRMFSYAGNDTQYFAVLLKPNPDSSSEISVFQRGFALPVDPINKKVDTGVKAKRIDTSFQLVSEPRNLKPGESWKQSFVMFAGPKEPKLLAAYGVEDVTYYGWFWFVSQPLTEFLHGLEFYIFGNYGLAIICLTVIVRLGMMPISRKAALNAQMMQALAPEMKKIADKYKNDMQKRHDAQQALFRKYNYNPLGGCGLMFLQLPIFIGLYRGLSVDTGLRDQPLIPGIEWCSNLGGPDQFLYWKDWMPGFLANETGWLGPYFNLLPIITIVLFIIQQKMFTPPPTDEQQAMTQKMMNFMMIFIGVMFFKVPSGLCIYFITSSVWGIVERTMIPKPQLPDHLKPSGAKSSPAGKSSGGRGGKSGGDPGASPNKPKPKPKPSSNGTDNKKKKGKRNKRRKRSKGRK